MSVRKIKNHGNWVWQARRIQRRPESGVSGVVEEVNELASDS